MRIALIAQQDFGKAMLDAFLARGASISGLLCPAEQDDGPLAEAATQRSIPLVRYTSLTDVQAEAALRGFDADLAVVGDGIDAVPEFVRTLPHKGAIQVHLSLLPRYRGPAPVQWPIARGEVETGLTVIRPGASPYEGPVILQRTCVIGPEDTAGELKQKVLIPMAAEALADAAGLVFRGEHLEIDQDENAATYDGPFGEAEAQVHWANHAEIIHNLIRAATPTPGAWTTLRGRKLRILDIAFSPTHRRAEVAGEPGEVIGLNRDGISVATRGGVIVIRRVRPEDGEQATAAEFAEAAGLAKGEHLG